MDRLTERDVQKILVQTKFDRLKNLVVPNCCRFTYGEADLIVVRPSGWVDEVEVKVSKADFRRDFKTKNVKHGIMAGEYQRECGYEYMTIRRFWFAMPHALAVELLEEVPDYAGLVGVSGTAAVTSSRSALTLTKAPVLPNAKKATREEIYQVVKNLSARYWDQFLKECAS